MPDPRLQELRETRDRIARLVREDELQEQADDLWATSPEHKRRRTVIKRLQARIHELEREIEERAA